MWLTADTTPREVKRARSVIVGNKSSRSLESGGGTSVCGHRLALTSNGEAKMMNCKKLSLGLVTAAMLATPAMAQGVYQEPGMIGFN